MEADAIYMYIYVQERECQTFVVGYSVEQCCGRVRFSASQAPSFSPFLFAILTTKTLKLSMSSTGASAT